MIGGHRGIKMSVYGYCRLALADNQEMTRQCKMIADYCETNHLEVDEYFCDNGASGSNLDRDELQKMFNKLNKGDVIIVKDVTRLTRSIFDYETLQERISNIGATIEVVR